MGKRIALLDEITLDGTTISNFCRAVSFSSEHEEIDVSGFNTTGADETLAGKTVQTVTLEVFGSYGSGEVHDVFYQIHRNKTIVAFTWLPDSTAAVSATNPELQGNVQVLTYNPGATRGEAEAFSVTLKAADAAGLFFSDT